MVTILTPLGMKAFNQRFISTEAILIPVFSDDSLHPRNNRLSLLYARFLDNDDEYIIPIDHSEAVSVELPVLDTHAYKFVPNRKELRHVMPLAKLIDVNLLQYVDTGLPTPLALEPTKAHTIIRRNFGRHHHLNRVIPISKHAEACGVLSSKMIAMIESNRLNLDDPAFHFLNFNTTDVLQQIEYTGIHVDAALYKQFFGPDTERHITSDSLTYSEYNVFTAAGRPSNRFGKVNFAALNTTDGSRGAFTSRFGDGGMLVLIDYDAYHLRLIAELMGFKFPLGNVHEYLGRMYFKTEALSDEQYSESKRISFQMLYGGITSEYKVVPFFESVQKFVDYLWSEFVTNGYISSPIGQRKLHAGNLTQMHPQKLFNYLIQLHETEHNMMTLEGILPLFHERQSKLMLYTYDSVMIDFHKADGIEFIRKVKALLECGNTYPAKVYVGANYHSMENVTSSFHL